MNSTLINTEPTKKCLNSIIYMSFVILFYLGVSNTIVAILGQFTNQNGKGWLGPVSNAISFVGSGIGSQYTRFIDKVPYKYSFFIGSLGSTFFVGLVTIFLRIGFTDLVEIVLLVGSLVTGIFSAFFFTSHFNYVNVCSEIDKQKTKYFAINMCIVQSSNIFGSLVSALLIQPMGQFNYALTMTILIFCISLFYLGLKNYKYHKNQSNFSIFLQQQCQNTVDQQQNQNQQKIKTQSYKNLNQKIIPKEQTFNIKQKIPKRIILSFCFSGVIISFIYGELSIVFFDTFQKFYEKEELNRITFIAFIIEGVGEFLGGLCVVFCQQLITKKLGLPMTYVIVSFLFLLTQFSIYMGAYFQILQIIYISCLFLGFCNCVIYTLALSIGGRWKQKGLSYYGSSQTFTVAAILVSISFLKLGYVIIIAVVMFLLSAFGALTFEKKMKNNEEKL